MKKRIAIFGSAFNPPTKGHGNAIMQAEKQFDEVWLLPSYAHPYGKKMIDFNLRIELVKMLIEELNSPKIRVSDIEKDYYESSEVEVVYTYDLLKFLSKRFPQYNFTFVCGEDNGSPEKWGNFFKSDQIDKDFGKFIVKEKVDIRSTYIRNEVKENGVDNIIKYTYPKIINKIKENNLYI